MTQETDPTPSFSMLPKGDVAEETFPRSADAEPAVSTQKIEAEYNASATLRHIWGMEAVRTRPGMYVGDTGLGGLHHLFKEVIDNAADEVMEGYCTQISVTLGTDHRLTVADNGRGIPVAIHADSGKSGMEHVLTDIGLNRKPITRGYRVRSGWHGVGLGCVNGLSAWLNCEVREGGKIHRQRFERGELTGPLVVVGECGAGEQGMKITYLADTTLFTNALDAHGSLAYEPDRLRTRIREIAFLNPAVTITFDDVLHGTPTETYHYERGIADYVVQLNETAAVRHPDVIALQTQHDAETRIEIALQYRAEGDETLVSFVNGIFLIDGGTHVTGFKSALTRALNRYARTHGLPIGDTKRSGGDLRKGLTAVVSVLMPKPTFYGAIKGRLANEEMEGAVQRAAYRYLSAFFEANPEIARAILAPHAAG